MLTAGVPEMSGAASVANAAPPGVEALAALDVRLEPELETSHAATHRITASPITASRRRKRAGEFGHAICFCNPPVGSKIARAGSRDLSAETSEIRFTVA